MAADESASVEQGDAASIPRVPPGTDLLSFPFSPTQGFVVSRIDGQASLQEIADSTATALEDVKEVIRMLRDRGALEWVRAPEAPRARPRRASSQRLKTPSQGVVRTRPPPPGTPRQLYDPLELEEEGVDLDVDRRRRILDTFYRLESLNFYEVLGVDPEAAKSEIRSAYFRLSKVFHPDTMYGKGLGSYKPKMEVVFRRLTEAYEVLGKKRRRAEYDEHIQLKRRTSEARQSVDKVERQAERIERDGARAARDAIVDSPTPEAATDSRPPPPESGRVARPAAAENATRSSSSAPRAHRGTAPPGASSTGSVPPHKARSTPPPTRPSAPVEPDRAMSDEAKERARQLMARKLAAASNRTAGPSHPSVRRIASPVRGEAPADKRTVLRGLAGSLRQAAGHTGGIDRATVHLEHAAEAEREGNLVSAVNSLRLAVALTQEREDIVAEYERVRQLHAAEMADSYRKQARYEERAGKWTEAALSWSKVCEGRPEEAGCHIHAAIALLEADGDLSQAKRYAERAKALESDEPLARRALGRVYAAMGMKLNAKRELEVFLNSDPDDDEMRKLLKMMS